VRIRGWLAWAGAGCAVALAYRGDWAAAGGAAVCVTVLAAWWVRGEFAATRARFRESAEMSALAASASMRRGVPRECAVPSGALPVPHR
jgi:hypothetical protein